MPLGQYDSSKLVNLGSNRWSIKPEVGLSFPKGRWTFDTYAGVWFFTENDAYYPGPSHRRQDPVVALQGHVSYTLGRRAWIAANATWYGGGEMRVDGEPLADGYRNTRLGITWAMPVGSRQSLKVAYSAGAATRVGADFRTISGAWQLLIF
jgi:outer membrane putative beta-barrel porin/alpha-amylase